MNSTLPTPERAWQISMGQLQLEMPKSYFDTWVKDAEFIACEDGVITIGSANAYACEWLTNRLTSTVSHLLTGILAQSVEVRFVVQERPLLQEEPWAEAIVEKGPPADLLSLQAEYQSIYDEIVQPEQVIVLPGYFLRYLPWLGVELAWLYVGFRQAAYEAGASRNPGKKVSAPAHRVAQFAGMSLRTFRRYSAKADTWQRLSGLVSAVEDSPRWQRSDDQHPHRLPRYYKVAMTLPLTPADERSLRAWLYIRLAQGKSPLVALKVALGTPPNELIPWEMNITPSQAAGGELHSVQEVIGAVCGPIAVNERAEFQELADQLAQHLMPAKDLIVLTHYFVTHWLPNLGHGPGWFVTLLRDRC